MFEVNVKCDIMEDKKMNKDQPWVFLMHDTKLYTLISSQSIL